jgi:hypothetical protein
MVLVVEADPVGPPDAVEDGIDDGGDVIGWEGFTA